jgi:hypothetical protein
MRPLKQTLKFGPAAELCGWVWATLNIPLQLSLPLFSFLSPFLHRRPAHLDLLLINTAICTKDIEMAEDSTDHGFSSASTLEPPPISHDPRPAPSRKSTLEKSIFDVHVTGTSTPAPSTVGYAFHKGPHHMVEFDEYFVS